MSSHCLCVSLVNRQQKQNDRDYPGLNMTDLPALIRITIHRRFNRPKLFCGDNTAATGPMGDDAKLKARLGDESFSLNVDKKGEEEEVEKLPPPPPEKPLPGDCCGSGCVRCVWDVYYEELEAYNKLLSENKK